MLGFSKEDLRLLELNRKYHGVPNADWMKKESLKFETLAKPTIKSAEFEPAIPLDVVGEKAAKLVGPCPIKMAVSEAVNDFLQGNGGGIQRRELDLGRAPFLRWKCVRLSPIRSFNYQDDQAEDVSYKESSAGGNLFCVTNAQGDIFAYPLVRELSRTVLQSAGLHLALDFGKNTLLTGSKISFRKVIEPIILECTSIGDKSAEYLRTSPKRYRIVELGKVQV
ncbi:MAG: hypothetical protein LBG64_02710 [Pseudomonadales bacterium]|jgi:hypothetical protein|nr:hypothetical protein [Pseudomonadales bacterium]